MVAKNSQLTAAQWDILQAVWDNEPCAAPTVQEALHKQRAWTYSTVKTLMDRMVARAPILRPSFSSWTI